MTWHDTMTIYLQHHQPLCKTAGQLCDRAGEGAQGVTVDYLGVQCTVQCSVCTVYELCVQVYRVYSVCTVCTVCTVQCVH